MKERGLINFIGTSILVIVIALGVLDIMGMIEPNKIKPDAEYPMVNQNITWEKGWCETNDKT